jgi:hypothetical protein
VEIIETFRKNMYIDAKEMSVFEICRDKDEVLRTIQKFEMKMVTRDRSRDGEVDKYDQAFIK